jgi:hypothetical protein
MAKSTKASSKRKKKSATNLVLAKAGTAFSIPNEVTSRRVILERRLPVGAIGRVSVDPTSSLWDYDNMRTAAAELAAAVDGNKNSKTIRKKERIIEELAWEIGYHRTGQQIAHLSLDSNMMQNKLLNIIQELRFMNGMENITPQLVAELSSIEAKVETAYNNYHQKHRHASMKTRAKKVLSAECAKALNMLANETLTRGSLEETCLLQHFQSNANAYETERGAENARTVERLSARIAVERAEIATLMNDAKESRESGNKEEAAEKERRANQLYDKSIAGKDNARQKKRRVTENTAIATLRNDAKKSRESGSEEEAAEKERRANQLYDKSINGREKKRRGNRIFCRAPSGEVILEKDVFAGLGPYLSGMELVSGKITSLTKEERKTGEELMIKFANRIC